MAPALRCPWLFFLVLFGGTSAPLSKRQTLTLHAERSQIANCTSVDVVRRAATPTKAAKLKFSNTKCSGKKHEGVQD
jgi:hypothetical protein